MQNYIICILIGVFAGVFAGMGMGGGTFLIPLLLLFLSFTQVQAQSVNLLAFIPLSVVAVIIYAKNHLINYKICFMVITTALVGSLLGVWLLTLINVKLLSKFYAVFLLIIGIFILIGTIKSIKNKKM